MKIVIAGGSGFLGGPLAEVYAEEGHEVIVLTRSLASGRVTARPRHRRARHHPPGLVGRRQDRPVGDHRRRRRRGDQPRRARPSTRADGRRSARRSCATAASSPPAAWPPSILAAAVPPEAFVSGSAVGYYGDTGGRPVTESSPPGSDFLAQLCEDWEAEAHRAESAGTRVAVLRTGVVLDRSGGALPRMMLPFRFFVGGPLGSGRQYVSWIQRLDWVEMVRWIVQTPEASGPINATAPAPVTNRELVRAIGRAMHRPSLLPVPPIALKLAVGGLADSLLGGQRVLPARPLALGYHFRYPDIDQAFRGMFGL